MASVVNQNLKKSAVSRYRKMLEEKSADMRRRMTSENFADIVHHRGEPSDEGDLSQQSHEEWLFVNRNHLEISVLKQVDSALRRIEQDAYGICLECDEPISTKRLDAVPWARYCVTCQERISAQSEATGEPEEDE